MPDILVDRIYEAAFVPQLWPAVLDEICARSRSASGAIQILKPGCSPLWAATERIRATLDAFIEGGHWKTCGRPRAVAGRDYPGFLETVSCLSEQQRLTDPVADILADLGLGWQVATLLAMPTAEAVGVTFEREAALGPHLAAEIDYLDSLRPHLARAAMMSARLGMERAQTAVATLQSVGLPAAVLVASGRVLAANDLFDACGVVLPVAGGGMRLTSAPADRIFHDVLAATSAGRGSRSIPLPAQDAHKASIVHVLPLRGAARDILSGAVLVAVTVVDPNANVMPVSVLKTLFDLTPKEAQLAGKLAAGSSLVDAAGALAMGVSTARTHLRAIFAKTGTGQQSELVALLKGAAFNFADS